MVFRNLLITLKTRFADTLYQFCVKTIKTMNGEHIPLAFKWKRLGNCKNVHFSAS